MAELKEKKESFLSKWAVPEYLAPEGSVLYWQELIFFWILFTWISILSIVLIPSLIHNIQIENYGGAIFRILSQIGILSLLIGRRYIRYSVRKTILSGIFLLGFIITMFIHKQIVTGIGALYMFSITASILFDKSGKYFVGILNLISCAVFGWLIYNGYYEQQFLHPLTIENSIRISFGTFVGTMIVSLPAAILIHSLFFFSRKQRKLTDLLSQETMLLLDAQEKLKTVNKELEDFAMAASHDIREPLRMVTSYSQLTQKKLQNDLDEKTKQYLDFAVNGATRLQKVIDDMLDYARLGANIEEAEDIEISRLLNEVAENLHILIKENGASVKFDSVPVIRGNRSYIFRLFQNLIENAIKFRKDESPQIQIKADKKEGEYIFSVKDNGIGIKKDDYNLLFKAFKKIHNREKYQGTGIGLSQCKKIVEMHGGRIWVESNLGEGATFYFTLPGLGVKAP
ncbi:MAG: ATP-binding protein [Spirochaetia bacterium]|nr:ATP-binding protein [Spirochaetia bacterium]